MAISVNQRLFRDRLVTTHRFVSDWPALLADLGGASNPAPFSDSSLPLFERSEFGQALKKGPDSRKQAIA
jgi:hypothetical protein